MKMVLALVFTMLFSAAASAARWYDANLWAANIYVSGCLYYSGTNCVERFPTYFDYERTNAYRVEQLMIGLAEQKRRREEGPKPPSAEKKD